MGVKIDQMITGSTLGGSELLPMVQSSNNRTTTPADLLTYVKDNVGPGSGLDADTLDGHQGAEYALLDSPIFTGTPSFPTGTTAITQSSSDNSTKLATTAFVQNRMSVLGGCLVYGSVDSSNPVQWGSESYDTHSIHSTVTNTHRLTVPTGITKVRLSFQIAVTDGNDLNRETIDFGIRKNGNTAFPGAAHFHVVYSNLNVVSRQLDFPIVSPVLSVNPGDFFDVYINAGGSVGSDATGNVNWFAMELLG